MSEIVVVNDDNKEDETIENIDIKEEIKEALEEVAEEQAEQDRLDEIEDTAEAAIEMASDAVDYSIGAVTYTEMVNYVDSRLNATEEIDEIIDDEIIEDAIEESENSEPESEIEKTEDVTNQETEFLVREKKGLIGKVTSIIFLFIGFIFLICIIIKKDNQPKRTQDTKSGSVGDMSEIIPGWNNLGGAF